MFIFVDPVQHVIGSAFLNANFRAISVDAVCVYAASG